MRWTSILKKSNFKSAAYTYIHMWMLCVVNWKPYQNIKQYSRYHWTAVSHTSIHTPSILTEAAEVGVLFIWKWCSDAYVRDKQLAKSGTPDSKVHGANMGPTWVLSAPVGPHVGPINLVIRDGIQTAGNVASQIVGANGKALPLHPTTQGCRHGYDSSWRHGDQP